MRGVRNRLRRIRAARADLQAAVFATRAETAALSAALAALDARVSAQHERTMQALRIVRDDDARARAKLLHLRTTPDYEAAFEETEPLVTIIIPTYTNWQQLRERALPSVLAQTYERFECLVIGDAAPAESAQAVDSFSDERLRFINLPYRGPYPPELKDAWMVVGTAPFNAGLELASGRWFAALDDDDALSPRHVELLLALAKAERAEVPYGRIDRHEPGGKTTVFGTHPPQLGQWNLQCSLFHAGLRFMTLQPTDWLFGIPNDWSLAERMLRIGVRFAMTEESVVDYYPSVFWTDQPERML